MTDVVRGPTRAGFNLGRRKFAEPALPLILSARDDGARLGQLEANQPALGIGAQCSTNVTAQRHPGSGGTARLAAGDERGPPGSSREDSSQRFTGGGGQIRYRGVEREDLLIEQYHIRATRQFPACLGAFGDGANDQPSSRAGRQNHSRSVGPLHVELKLGQSRFRSAVERGGQTQRRAVGRITCGGAEAGARGTPAPALSQGELLSTDLACSLLDNQLGLR